MYVLGEPVLIYVGSFDVKEVLIAAKNENYRFIGELGSQVRFNPPSVGNYTIKIKKIPLGIIIPLLITFLSSGGLFFAGMILAIIFHFFG